MSKEEFKKHHMRVLDGENSRNIYGNLIQKWHYHYKPKKICIARCFN